MDCKVRCNECHNWECKCSDCISLVDGPNGEWFCDEYNRPCSEIAAECGEWGG